MSTAVAQTIPIGPVEAYWNNIRLGSPMTQATVRYSKETVQAGLQDTGQNAISRKFKETAEIDIIVADIKMDQLQYVYDQVTGWDARTTIQTGVYAASTSDVFRFKEEQTLDGTANITLDRTGFEAGTIKVFKSDWSNGPDGYTSATDFTADNTAGTVARLSGGVITDGQTVYIEYNQSATCTRITAGGKLPDFEAVLRLVHYTEGNKALQLHAWRAVHIGASDFAIQQAAEFGGIPMTFHLLADLTKKPGKQLFDITLEA